MSPSNLIEDPFKISIAVRQFLVQCHDIHAKSPGTIQHTNAYTLVVVLPTSGRHMHGHFYDWQTGRRANHIKALSATIMHNYARAQAQNPFLLRELTQQWVALLLK